MRLSKIVMSVLIRRIQAIMIVLSIILLSMTLVACSSSSPVEDSTEIPAEQIGL